jgi:hypothetical protein
MQLSFRFVATLALVACTSRSFNERQAAGDLDSSVANAIIDAAGPGVQVTRTDARSLKRATEFRLTPIVFSRFLAAADSVAARQARDPSMREYLSVNITDAGSPEPDAGLKWLAANPAVATAINSAGMSVRDYFVASIAIGSAERFLNQPSASPPTPTAKENATFLQQHRQELARLSALRENRPVSLSTP